MLNLPFLATDAPSTDKSAPQKTQTPKASDRADERSGFKDVFEERGRDDGRQPVEVVQKRENPAATEADDSDAVKLGKTPTETEAETTDGTKEKSAEPVRAPTEKVAAEAVRTPVEQASAFAKTIRDLENSGAGPDVKPKPAKIAEPVEVKPQPATTPVPKDATPILKDVEKSVPATAGPQIEVADDLEPMRVQVRSTTSSGGAAVQANLMQRAQGVPETDATKTTDKDVKTKKSDELTLTRTRASEPVATAPSATLQWRAQTSAEAVQSQLQNAGSAALQTGEPEGELAPTTEALIAAREESGTRLVASGLDAAQQARFSQTTHNPAHVMRQVAEAVKTSDKGIIELTMDPPELGRLRLAMTEVSGVMNITISTENPATADLMRRHIELLRKDFIEMGYDDVSFTFEQGDTNGQQSSEQPQWAGSAGGEETSQSSETAHSISADTPNTPLLSPTAGSGGLDIRL
ncbi:flagellar hook-length control protein FliK [Shimia sp. Alg240-R146]|uniref:flagellar hook-length control protein FliK n=1 Tax=Shimia sp. Alg240-R146 TaxID=2993449 RepID=UPI0022E726EA|nr:flagellar hook-length control protein FliK [Shimia sp. Alg240-R146]